LGHGLHPLSCFFPRDFAAHRLLQKLFLELLVGRLESCHVRVTERELGADFRMLEDGNSLLLQQDLLEALHLRRRKGRAEVLEELVGTRRREGADLPVLVGPLRHLENHASVGAYPLPGLRQDLSIAAVCSLEIFSSFFACSSFNNEVMFAVVKGGPTPPVC